MKEKLLEVLRSYPPNHQMINHRYDLFLFQYEHRNDGLVHIATNETAPIDVELSLNGISVKMSSTVQNAIEIFSKV